MGNKNLHTAKRAKSDEFYTGFDDIQREMNCYYLYNKDFLKDKTVLLPCDDPEWSNFTKFFALNFNRYQLKKLISTSYAADAKKINFHPQISLFEESQPNFDESKTNSHGKIFTLDRETIKRKQYPPEALTFDYLEGDGDFRSAEVTKLRDEADVIITNPPFSLFREFLAWILEGGKQFLIIANVNCFSYKEVFPLIKADKIWLGNGFPGMVGFFKSPYEDVAVSSEHREGMIRNSGVHWLTNIDHGRRHEPLRLMNYDDNVRYSKHKQIRGIGYRKYDNYDAIEVPFVDAIPDDYDGVMGVPITFLDKYCPEQFEILGLASGREEFEVRPTKRYKNPVQHNLNGSLSNGSKANTGAAILYDKKPDGIFYTADNANGFLKIAYTRILIRFRR